MVKATVLYGHPADPDAFETYYAETHLPLVAKAGLPRTELARIVSTATGEPAPHYRMFEAWFDSMQQLQELFGSPQGQAMAADLPNFATGGATILISTVD